MGNDRELLLVRLSGEITTKGRGTRLHFLRRLKRNLEHALDTRGIEGEVHREWSRIYVTAPRAARPVVARVFGVHSLSPAVERPFEDLGEVVSAGAELFGDAVEGKRFAVRARRTGEKSRIPFRSMELERVLGAELFSRAAGVDLDDPEVTVSIEARPGVAYFFRETIQGPGGLPLGTEGRALALVSGGFDSAVAAWSLLKRGVRLDYLFCNLGGRPHREGVLRVMKLVADEWSAGSRPRLWVVDLQPMVESMRQDTDPRHWQLLLKRLMYRAGSRLARFLEVEALVTGEAVGQVSSQTLRNLRVIEEAASYPVLRPLVGHNKDEIVALARRIGTYELSAAVPEYCALDAEHPATHASFGPIRDDESRLDLEAMERAVDDAEAIDLRSLDLASLGDPDLGVESPPAGAEVVDLRSPGSYATWHYPEARRMDYFAALRETDAFDPDTTWVFYCEVGLKSAHVAEALRERGIDARHFQGGLRQAIRSATEADPAHRALLSPALLADD